MLMAMPGPSGAVTMATVSQTLDVSGMDERSCTLRSATTPGAVTCAEPVRRMLPTGQDVFAASTVPTAGLGGDVTVVPATMEVEASVPVAPAGPAGPAGPATPTGPATPAAP